MGPARQGARHGAEFLGRRLTEVLAGERILPFAFVRLTCRALQGPWCLMSITACATIATAQAIDRMILWTAAEEGNWTDETRSGTERVMRLARQLKVVIYIAP